MEGPTSTGIPNRKLAMWTFIGSECMLFGTLIATYMIYRGRNLVPPYPHDLLNIPFITVTTFVLLMSSLMMVLALAAVQRNDLRATKLWLVLTALFGLIFLGGQYDGFGMTTGASGSSGCRRGTAPPGSSPSPRASGSTYGCQSGSRRSTVGISAKL